MAVFGVPIPRTSRAGISRDAINAVASALAMEDRLKELNEQWRRLGKPTARMRIGIFTGPVIAGGLGPADRLSYTVIGDTVNTASRLESTRDPGLDLAEVGICRTLVGETTAEHLGAMFVLREVGTIALKGKENPLRVLQVLGWSQTTAV